MPQIPAWVLGRHVTAFTLTPQTPAIDGTLAPGSAKSLAGLWDEVDLEFEEETEEISAADSIRQNTVIVKDLWRFRAVQILNKGPAGNINPLATLYSANDQFQLTLTRGTNTWTIYIVKTGYTENVRKSKSVGIFTGAIIDAGPATYA
jgi:hypothetical protein